MAALQRKRHWVDAFLQGSGEKAWRRSRRTVWRFDRVEARSWLEIFAGRQDNYFEYFQIRVSGEIARDDIRGRTDAGLVDCSGAVLAIRECCRLKRSVIPRGSGVRRNK